MQVEVVLDGWKSLVSAVVPLDGLIVLAGPNGSGKTNILEALSVLDPAARSVLQRGGRVLPDVASPRLVFAVRFACDVEGVGPDSAALEELLLAPWREGGDADAFLDRLPENIWWDPEHPPQLASSTLPLLYRAVGEGLSVGLDTRSQRLLDAILDRLWRDPLLVLHPHLQVTLSRDPRRTDGDALERLARELLPAVAGNEAVQSLCAGLLSGEDRPELICLLAQQYDWKVPLDAARQSLGRVDAGDIAETAAFWWAVARFGRPVVVDVDVTRLESALTKGVAVVHDRLWHFVRPGASSTVLPFRGPTTPCTTCLTPDHAGQPSHSDVGVEAPRVGDPWLQPRDDGSVWPRRSLSSALELISERVNAALPAFVQEQGTFDCELVPVHEWSANRPRCRVAFREPEGVRVAGPDLGAGIWRWLALTITLVLRELAHAERAIPAAGRPVADARAVAEAVQAAHATDSFDLARLTLVDRPQPGIVLIDEPEQHLHRAAQDVIAHWCVQQARRNVAVVVATHSPAFFQLPPEQARLVQVRKVAQHSRTNELSLSMDTDAATRARLLGGEVGMGQQALLQLVRGVILVEGEWDATIVRAFYGAQIDQQRVLVVPLGGFTKLEMLAQYGMLQAYEVPVAVLMDRVRAERVLSEDLHEDLSKEEKLLVKVLRQQPGVVQPVSYPLPDVLCALPEEAIRRAYPNANMRDWESIVADFEHRSGKFKDFALQTMRIFGYNQDTFIPTVLSVMEPGEPPTRAFQQAMQHALAIAAGKGNEANEWGAPGMPDRGGHYAGGLT